MVGGWGGLIATDASVPPSIVGDCVAYVLFGKRRIALSGVDDIFEIPLASLIGPDEAANNSATLRNLETGEQTTLLVTELANLINQ